MKSKLKFHLCLICMFLLTVTGCKVRRPDSVIPESKMENLLYDYHLAKAMGDNLPYNENYKKALYLDAVFNKYGTTEAVFDSSLVWYTRNTEILSKIYERVSKRLKSQQDEINHLIALRDNKPKMSEPGDSIDVWPWKRLIRLTGKEMNNRYAFELSADSNFKDRDTLIWEVRYKFLNPMRPDSMRSVMMAMQVIYEKDTLNRVETISKSGRYKIRLVADTLGAMKEIKGFIYYPMLGENGGTLLADHFTLTRFHCLDSLSVNERDSINKSALLKADSLKRVSSDTNSKLSDDTLQNVDRLNNNQRLNPENMNRRRTGRPEKRQEQIEVEQHIQQEKLEQRRERINRQRRTQQPRQNPR